MTREEAIADMQYELFVACHLIDREATIPVKKLANWITAIRDPVKELPLPDSEVWWWEWSDVDWRLVAVRRNPRTGKMYYDRPAGYKHLEFVDCRPGRWVKASPPPAASEPTAADSANADLQADLAAMKDDPELDGTDLAHPAWWRGHDNGVWGATEKIRKALDDDNGVGVISDAKLEAVRRDVLKLKAEFAHLLINKQQNQ